jgi:hypothetical protein
MSKDVSEGFDDLFAQLGLVLDAPRVTAFAKALVEVVKPNDVVADLGTGSGLLAVLAARAGARKVYAVERGGIADLAQRVFRENGVDDRIVILRGDARDVAFPEPPSVVVSETLGNLGIEEDIVALLKLMRPRCTPDVRFIPSHFDVMVAPVWDERLEQQLAQLGDVAGVSLAPLRARVVQRSSVDKLRPANLMGPSKRAAAFDLSHDMLPASYRVTLTTESPCRINALGGWFEARLSPNVKLTNEPGSQTSWSHVKLPLDPPLVLAHAARIEVEIEPRFSGGRALMRWSAKVVGGEQREGDVLASSGGALRDFAQQLGLGVVLGNRKIGSPQLEAWTAILANDSSPSIDALAARLLAAMPQRYAGIEDAREEVVRLLDACNALG